MKDAGGELKTVRALSPQQASHAAATNGVIIDRLGYLSAVVTVITGAVSGTPDSQSMAIKVEESNSSDLSGAADITGATGTITTADSVKEINLDLKPAKRYIRVTQTTTFVAGTSPKIFVGATITLGEAQYKPAE